VRRAVVVGTGEQADAVSAALRADGCTVGPADGQPVDVLALVATSGTTAGALTATPDAAFVEAFEQGASAPFRVARDLWPALRAAGGAIVVVTSVTALRGDHEVAARSIAAAAAVAVTELLAAEGADVGIRANAICVADDERSRAAVADTVVWLARPGAGAISGATIRIDGAATAALRADTRA
jgi:hypothetical protein